MVIAEKNEVLHEIALPLLGIMSNLKMSELIQEEKQMVKLLQERGYAMMIQHLQFYSFLRRTCLLYG